ncbi:galactose oxidase [Rhizoclosmatium globosum]|uniref:Galactose oxidase n=1 Tax=Rhizoclosmatium globosum TaxID=329046 RepID=A0A1Y2CF58_9FUNG|nr:galactose oxidase [Rhizoclosmatium globosum]|eukprot:ORY45703.1 galactose oxidase [Rhizoclosmatium globosum]
MSTSKAIPPSILLFPVTSTPLNEPRAKPPAPRVGASLTFYAPTNEVILFGGASHETDSRVWRKLPTSSSPSARYDHLALIVNRAPTGREAKSSHLLVFGGASDDAPLNDLWFLDLDAKTWVNSTGRMKGCVPSPRTIQSCGYLAGKVGESDRIYLVGGGEGGDRPVDDNVVRVLDIDSLTWTHVKTITTRCPPSLQGHTTTLVNINSIPYLIVFGGSVNSVSSAGLWILNLESNEWTHLEGDGEEEWPASRCGHTMTRV